MKERKFGLFTAIAMIVGVVIGSGIFFKSDNILVATNGSIKLGVLFFALAAISIIFGCLSISELASRNTQIGGIISYAEYSANKGFACAVGWFHTFLYYPTLIAVISWVVAIYINMLFGINSTLEKEILLGLAVLIIMYFVNIISTKVAGYFQNASTVIKLLPLIIIGILGLIYGDTSNIELGGVNIMGSYGWIAAIAPIAFSFDGWIVATSIAHEIEEPDKNLRKALIFAPIFILAIYLLYFIGITTFIGPDVVMELGDAHVSLAANKLFGPMGGKIVIVFVIISILGTLNGLIMGHIRLPYSLSIRGMFPKSKEISRIRDSLGIPVKSAMVAFIICSFMLLAHYLTQKFGMLPNSDISEISISFNYLLFIVFYYKVFRMGRSGEIDGLWKGTINPILATVGSIMILLGSIGNSLFVVYAIICSVVLISALVFWKYQQTNK